MTASNRLFAALFLMWAAFSCGPAAAQGQPAPAAQDGAAPAPPPPDPHAVAVDTLDAPRPDSMGLVSAAAGGFSDSLWRGTPAVTAQTLVSSLPHRYAVPAARRLALKFLLSAAPVEGAANSGAMLEARILALGGMAAWDDALALMDFVPAQTRSPMLVKARVTGLLAKGRLDAACGEARAAEDTDATWAKLQILCQFVSGQNSAVTVSLGLMREQGVDDKLFLWATEVAQGNTAAAPPADFARAAANGTIDPVVLALLRQAGYLLPKAVVAAADPTTLLFAAQTALVPPKAREPEPEPAPAKGAKGKAKKAVKPVKPADTDDLRLYTIERAAAAGVLDAESVRNLYATISVSDDATNTSADSIAIDTARQRAATYQLAILQSASGSRAEVIARVMDLTRVKPADAVPGPVLTALIYAPTVSALPATLDLASFAPMAVRVLAAADSAAPMPPADPSVRPWIELLQGQAMTSPASDSAKGYASVWPYARLTRPGLAPITPEEVSAWQATLPPDHAPVLRGVGFDLLTAVGDGLPTSELQAAVAAQSVGDGVTTGPAPSTLLWNAIAQAERSGRIGEVTALALRFLGADGGQPGPIAITRALESLTVAGRAADARAIAVELALDRGL